MSSFNKSYKKYFNMIEKARSLNRVKLNREHLDYEYFENHHIIPESLGGSNGWRNMVLLTPEEHYICHSLLPDFCESESRRKMLYAWHLMKDWLVKEAEELIGPDKYGELKRAYSEENYGINSPNAKPIYQLDPITGKIIKKWDYVKQAIDSFKEDKTIKACSFSERARDTSARLSHGFCWAYEKTLEETIKNIQIKNDNVLKGINSKERSVYQLNIDTGEILKIWHNVAFATKAFGGIFGIASCARNIQKSAGGFCWAYKETLEEIQSQLKKGIHFEDMKGINNPVSHQIYQLDPITGKIIKKWDYVLIASETLKINKGNMANCANKGLGRIAGGFCWAYEETLEETIKNINVNATIELV